MSPTGRTEKFGALRRLIARIEAGDETACSYPQIAERSGRARLPLGAEQPFWLDAALGGGLKRGALYEVAPAKPGDEAAVMGFALSLAIRFARAERRPLIYVAEDFAWRETGVPYGPGLLAWGFDPGRLTLVRAADARATLWALEEALKCRACAVVIGELWGSARRYGEAPARRLVLAARQGGASCILLHCSAFGGALHSHGAQARLAVSAARPPDHLPISRAPALPGPAHFAVQVLKTKFEGGCAVPFDPEEARLLAWNPVAGRLEDCAGSRPREKTRPKNIALLV